MTVMLIVKTLPCPDVPGIKSPVISFKAPSTRLTEDATP